MKRGLIVFFLLIASMLSICIEASATEETTNQKYEAYGLCVISKLIEYDENFDMNKYVDYDSYARIISFWFGVDTVAPPIPTNADAIYDMARFVTEDVKSGRSITEFKDFGFIEKDYRDAYKIMCSAGYLNTESEYLNPNYPLCYGVFFDLLMNFEENASFNHNFEINCGTISDSYSENKNIIIKQNTDIGEKKYKFSRMHSFYVYDSTGMHPYSYNIKRGAYAKIYTVNDEIVFVSITNKNSVPGKYTVHRARLYLYNEYDKQLIFTNDISGSYITYYYDDLLLVYDGNDELNTSDINSLLLDRYCYFITDNSDNTVKYINMIG